MTANILKFEGSQSSDVEMAAVRDLITTGLGKALADLHPDKFERLIKTASTAIETYERDGSSLLELLRQYQG